MNCSTASSEQSLQIVSSLPLSVCFTHLLRVATGDVVAFVLAVMLLLCFATDDAAHDDDNNNDDQGLFVKQSM